MHFYHLSDKKSGSSHRQVTKYYHIEGQDKVGGIPVDKFAKEHNLLKFTFVRHPFERYEKFHLFNFQMAFTHEFSKHCLFSG